MYYADFTDSNNKRTNFSLKTRDEAKAEKKIDILNMKYSANTVEEFNIFLETHRTPTGIVQKFKHKAPLQSVYTIHFLKYLRVIKQISDKQMSAYNKLSSLLKYHNITWDHLHDVKLLISFQNELLDKYAHTTVEKKMTLLRAFVNWLYKNNHIEDKVKNSALNNIMTENKTRIIKAKTIMTILDFDKMLKHFYEKDKDMYWYLVLRYIICTRITELAKLQIANIKIKTISMFQLKTQRMKSITIPPLLMAQIKHYISENSLSDEKYLFKGAEKNDKYYYLRFKKALKELELDSDYQLDQIRHLSATVVDEMFDKYTAMLYLGHKISNDVTSRYICNEGQKTLKVSNTLCSLVPELADFTMPPEEITQNDVSNSQLSEKTQER